MDLEKPFTRRAVLSTINSLYDPLGLVTPVALSGKLLLRELLLLGKLVKTSNKTKPLGWDDPLPPLLHKKWSSWKRNLADLESLAIPRCYRPLTLVKLLGKSFMGFRMLDSIVLGQWSTSWR